MRKGCQIICANPITTNWYVRDAQGNIMAIYNEVEDTDTVILEELSIFGSSRLGMVKPALNMNTATLDTVHYQLKRGQKRYEFSNHLGNVLAVVTDKLKPICNDDTVSYFNAEVLYGYDYSPFGAILPGRMYVGDTVCSSPGHYEDLLPTQFSFVFNIGGMLASGDEIHISNSTYDNALAVYNSSYTTLQEYIDEVIANAAAYGLTAEDLGGGDIRITFGLNEDYMYINCSDFIEVYSYLTNTITIYELDCTPVPTYIPPSGCEPTDYRFGFNGKEKDNEAKGVGNSYDFGARIYESRLGRWMSLDPLMAKYPSTSPYCFSIDNPIFYIDFDGREIIPTTQFLASKAGPVYLSLSTDNSIFLKYAKPYLGVGVFDPNLSLKFEAATTDYLLTANGWTTSDYNKNSVVVVQHFAISITLNSNRTEATSSLFGLTTTSKRTDIAIARTLIHEMIHASLEANPDKFGYSGIWSNESHHEFMATFLRDDVKAGLKEFANKHGIGMSEDDLEVLSWGGLTSTNAWKMKYDTKEKQDTFQKRFEELERQTVITDDETGEIDVLSGEDKNMQE